MEHVRALVAGGAPFVYAYYSGVDEVAHAYGLEPPFFPAELRGHRPPGGADLLDALPDDVAVVVTADHGQVQVGPDGWRSLAPLHPMVEAYAGDGRFRYLPRAGRAPPPSSTPPPRSSTAATGEPGCSDASSCSTKGGSAPTRCRRPTGASATSCSPPRHRVGFVDPTLPYEAQLIGAHGSHHRGRDGGPARGGPRVAAR